MFKLKHISKYFLAVTLLLNACKPNAQSQTQWIDSVRNEYQIPAIAYAIVTSDSIIELNIAGQAKANSNNKISSANRFHIGSNTKAVTSLIASDLVESELLQWNTSLFEVFPEFKNSQTQINITLFDLLNFKAPLTAFSYNTEIPPNIYTGKTDAEQRYQIAKYLLTQKPNDKNENGLYLTNTSYILAGLMLEKASGETYEQLVNDLGGKFNVNFQFGSPSKADSNPTYGHDENSNPITKENIKLNWLLSSGNLNISLADYAKFFQSYLQAIKGKSKLFSKQQIEYLLSNFYFSFGWFKEFDEVTKSDIYYNFGNANGFMSSVIILKEKGVAIIVLANKSSEKTEDGINEISTRLKNKYGR